MNLFESFVWDIKNMDKWFPKEIKMIDDEQSGIFACEIYNHPNPYVPEIVRIYNDKAKGKFALHYKQNEIKKRSNGERIFKVSDRRASSDNNI